MSDKAGSTVERDAADSGNKTCSLSFLLWNVDGLHSKIADGDFKRYVEQFDFACLVETFAENSYDLTRHFTGYDKYVSPAVKLSHHGRCSGGVLLLVRKCFSKLIERVDIMYDQMIVVKFAKTLFNTTHDVLLICVYVPPQGSPYYNTAECNCHIDLIDKCVLDLFEKYGDFHLILCGDINARTSNFQANVKDNDSYLPFTDPLSPNSLMCQSRASQDDAVNDFGRALLDLCVCFDLFIHNGECQGDEEGKFTYISGHGNSMIDYCITSVDFVKHVKRLCV